MLHDVAVIVPRLAGAVPKLHHPNPAFDQPARDEHCRMDAFAVQVAMCFGSYDVECVGDLALHAKRSSNDCNRVKLPDRATAAA